MEMALPAGAWSVYHVDMTGAYRESEPLRLKLTDSVVCHWNLHPGWNLLAVPWSLKELAWNQEALLLEQYKGHLFTVDSDNYVLYDGPFAAGSAYWVYASEKNTVTLYGTMDDLGVEAKMDERLPQGTSWYFGTDPGVEKRSSGMIWNGRKFVPDSNEATGAAGWWFIR